MDRDDWREKRRDAARKLGELGDTRATAVLIQVVKSERFDAIAEIAIEALGKLRDSSAVPVLQQVAADSSRDRYARKAARASLRRLGAKESASASDSGGSDTNGDENDDLVEIGSTGLSSGLPSSSAAVSDVELTLRQPFEDDTLAANDRLTLGVGDARLAWDSVSKTTAFDGNVALQWQRIRERKRLGLILNGSASAVSGAVNYDGDDSASRLLSAICRASAEARFYAPGRELFAIASGELDVAFDHLRVNRPGPNNTTSENFLWGDFTAGVGGGYGRILNMGPRLRLNRIEAALQRRKMLGRRIQAQTADKIFRAFWKLRRRLGYYYHLVALVKILREAGVLLSEPDAGTSYALLQILMDGQLNWRPSGIYGFAAISESVVARDDDLGREEGRIENVLSKVSYGKQSEDGLTEMLGNLFFRKRILADENAGEASPWSAQLEATLRRYRYGPNYDPKGALDIRAGVGASDDGFSASEMATRVYGSLGWLWIPSRASRFRFAGEARLESGETFLGLNFEAQYGLLDVGYVGAPD
jgi:hypothetical protein